METQGRRAAVCKVHFDPGTREHMVGLQPSEVNKPVSVAGASLPAPSALLKCPLQSRGRPGVKPMLGKGLWSPVLCLPGVLYSGRGRPEGFSVRQSARAPTLPQTRPHASFPLLTWRWQERNLEDRDTMSVPLSAIIPSMWKLQRCLK